MGIVALILMIAAVVLLLLAVFGVPNTGRINLVALGLALWAIAVLLGGAVIP